MVTVLLPGIANYKNNFNYLSCGECHLIPVLNAAWPLEEQHIANRDHRGFSMQHRPRKVRF